ncbi:MSHA biogenesis protein MshP [Aquabacterium fontiphilum]|jgi:MSHA biogenesis protein MshP|uniref:MSHA biogenesis protein MshP n=1 Tax=Aquabacterium fontiphilum TaxID=450365 RepID=UPI001F2836DB|nr:MSHA biogenesis protein MshP [Aquabacterium fontiphilum]
MTMPDLQQCQPRHPHACRVGRQRGLGVIAAMVVLVMLATLGAAILRLTWTQQTTLAQDLDSARAFQGAYAGAQWGMFQALRGSWTTCAGSTQTLDLRSTMGVRVTVVCQSDSYIEGETSAGTPRTVRLYTVTATACNGAAATCPDNASVTRPSYVERVRVAKVANVLETD